MGCVMKMLSAFLLPAIVKFKSGFMLARRFIQAWFKKLISCLPRDQRYKIFRACARCNPKPSQRLVLKIAETKEELEACFSVLHDAYVDNGFMRPDPSGMRVTIYHALPTTATLCAKYDGEVVGTISLIRESSLGLPLQQIFDLSALREKGGHIAEVSALAIHRKFRKKGGSILFPLMKFICEYCTNLVDIRHLVIAVNPAHIEMYESLLFFRRLTARMVDRYDFVNGAPAIGATLDLKEAPELFRKHYSSKPPHRNLHAYFTQVELPNIQWPRPRSVMTNDPLLTPELLDHFFNVRTKTFENLSLRTKALLHSIYDRPDYQTVLPAFAVDPGLMPVRHHPFFSAKRPPAIAYLTANGRQEKVSQTYPPERLAANSDAPWA